MNLLELAQARPQAGEAPVPAWTLGCFHRRSITYATGAEDTDTRVVWIQSHGLTGDIRIPADRPAVSRRGSLADCSWEELAWLTLAEGGVARTAFADGRMSWSDWVAFQPYDKWPEPGELSRVGACLIEVAPSGVYVEDWRAQAGSGGLLAGLQLLAEGPPGQAPTPRDGGLVVAGGHAILSLGRRAALPGDEPLPVQMRRSDDPQALAEAIFEAQTDYAVRDPAGGGYRVALSTNPFREGEGLDLDGFGLAARDGLVTQSLATPQGPLVRLWRVDTLLEDGGVLYATEADEAGAAWLAREAARLPHVTLP